MSSRTTVPERRNGMRTTMLAHAGVSRHGQACSKNPPMPMAFHSFGGWKSSLFGDHHMHGTEGVGFYTRLKTITSPWPAGVRNGAEFVMPAM